jgi:hypothetical protein
MSNNSGDFIPRAQTAATNYALQVHRGLSARDYDAAMIGATDDDVTELGDSIVANQAVLSEIRALKKRLKGLTKKLIGPKGTHRRMVNNLRKMAAKARVSDAPNAELQRFGFRRKTTNPSRRSLTADAPDFTFVGAIPGVIRLAFREGTTNNPRARAKNAIGVQVAIVDGTAPRTDGEADKARKEFLSHSPTKLDSTTMPAKVRLYARWINRRGETSAWTTALPVTVM